LPFLVIHLFRPPSLIGRNKVSNFAGIALPSGLQAMPAYLASTTRRLAYEKLSLSKRPAHVMSVSRAGPPG
jgi:hypothetical protein